MTINSRSKGKNGELELVHVLRDRGIYARRGQQFEGTGESPDVVHSIPGLHIECKRCERGNLYDWLEQATRDASDTGQVPIVCHRRSRRQWVAILPLSDFLDLIVGEKPRRRLKR